MEGRAYVEVHRFNTYLALVNHVRNVKTELYGNLMFPTLYRTEKEEQKMIEDIIQANELLEAIFNRNEDYVETLLKKGYRVPFYKDVMYRLAVKSGNFKILLLLYNYRCYNMSHPCLLGMMDCIAELGSVKLFETSLNHFIDMVTNMDKNNHECKQIRSVKEWYENMNFIDFTRITKNCLHYGNIPLFMHLTTKYSDYIDMKSLKNNEEIFRDSFGNITNIRELLSAIPNIYLR